jgi:hypothetical protein
MGKDYSQRLLSLFLVSLIGLTVFSVVSVPVSVAIASAQEDDPVRYWGVIVAGTDGGVQSIPRDANYMFHVLNVHYRFDGIEYLSYDTSYVGVDKRATRNSTREAIREWLNRSDDNDVIFIFIAAHGGGYNSHTGELSEEQSIEGLGGDEGDEIWNVTAQEWVGIDECFYIGNEIYWDDELRADIANLNYGRLVFSSLACFSGGMIDDLSAPNRTIMTAANETYTCSLMHDVDGFSPWTESFINGLHGGDAGWNYLANQLKHKGITIDTDLDNDGHVSMWEAWNYSWWDDRERINGVETPWLDADGNGLPTYKNGNDMSAPYEEPGDRIEAETLWLMKKPPGDVDNDGVVNILDAIILASAFGSSQGESNWNRSTDLNTDGRINILDAITLSINFGESMCSECASGKDSGAREAGADAGTTVLVDPAQAVVFRGESFSINVKITDVSDLYGWEFKLYWNSTILNCTNAVVQTPAEWQNNKLDYAPGLESNYNITHARYWAAQSAANPAPSFSGSMTIATLTFQALQPGTTLLILTDTVLGDSTAEPITFNVSSGAISVYYGRYMRCDTQTVNGLSAYNLSIPESTSYLYSTRSGMGYGASWGVRAWIRHSDGTEQEINMDGQTGTPKAVVWRSSGSGIQSGAVSVAQTGLQPNDSIVIRVYVQVGDSDWTLCETFTTEQLQVTMLQATTWIVYYYTWASYNRLYDVTRARLYWGDTTHNSRIQNLQYT